MTKDILQAKLEQAINDIIIDSGLDITNLPSETQIQIRNGIRREADKKAQKLYEYLEEFIYNRFSAIEGRLQNVENRMTSIDDDDPRSSNTTS
jgi:hypothetical protein